MKKRVPIDKDKKGSKFKYSILSDELLRDPTISDRAKLTWQYLYSMCYYKRSKNPKTFYPLGLIAFKCGVSKRCLQRGIEELVETPWLTNESRPGKTSIITLHKSMKKDVEKL